MLIQKGYFVLFSQFLLLKQSHLRNGSAKVGYERIQEIEDPELAMKRTRAIYKAKGYSDDWIEKRMRGIAIREELTSEWQKRAIKEQKEYAILTAEISKAAFGKSMKDGLTKYEMKREITRLKRNSKDSLS